MNLDNIDRFGHCVVCHKNLLVKRVVDNKVVDMFLPTYSDTMFLLSDGSQMQVTICKVCKESTDLNDPQIHSNVMEAIQKGWELEAKLLVENDSWSKEKADNYVNKMSKLSIDCHSEKLDKFVIQNRSLELMNVKVEPLKEEVADVIN